MDRIYGKIGSAKICKMKSHLVRHGIPDTLISDNGSPFNGYDWIVLYAVSDIFQSYNGRNIMDRYLKKISVQSCRLLYWIVKIVFSFYNVGDVVNINIH